jgi:signal transduction histidine kinase
MAVWDNGRGIPADIRASVFEPFVSFGKAEGSGLGLAIAKKIVEDHGGEIYLDRKKEIGTLFVIRILFAIPEDAIMASAPNHSWHESNGTAVSAGSSP